ncbi:hypothetical protein HBI56_109790 [Parastagonospora nodorum]|uniref:NmrA-like domain-containing protein n=1 Tax=Phaeosphaeria nodorum (strain SN15 / ATCC MYA-4574 / FGSC 10173) TaxID=321614 RepID=A0A7U2HW68_PHANO|nr:hypothetical protein HBH56_042340 [Parastagonospora nodorum]QRC92938.1 hypothetical protein JI435_080180 [Parastagonospora nodorum SN15]KAH3933259.1 hypothetical protein HBH54_070090 [Parastagonospora nodorum]KAH3943404.1 hypothetical protein HBH53_174260 [Parastagonospora nodorum]KAH3961839.1 hypothetical protein HBH52_229480 [Parastagonospora nodorum]
MTDKIILVTRATGSQGRAAIAHLVRSGWNIRALVIDPSSDRAIVLKSLGPQVDLVQGTWKDPSSIEAVMRGCQALVFIQRPSFTDDAEFQEGHVILNLAKVAGVQHVVFSSSLVLNNPNAQEDIGHLSAAPAALNKAPVEDLVKASGMKWTLLRPGYFMTNLLPPVVDYIFPEIKAGQMSNSYGPDCILTLVDPDDIGAFAAAAFNDPGKFDGRTITIVGENVRFDDIVKAFSKATGRDIEAIYRTEE